MKLTKKGLLKELNKDLEWEYAAAIQYVNEGGARNGSKTNRSFGRSRSVQEGYVQIQP